MQNKSSTVSQPLTLAEVRALKAKAGEATSGDEGWTWDGPILRTNGGAGSGVLRCDPAFDPPMPDERRHIEAADPSTVVRLCEAVEAMAGALGGMLEGYDLASEHFRGVPGGALAGFFIGEVAAARAALPPDSPGGGS